MAIIFHKTSFVWDSIEDIGELQNPEEYLIDPIFADGEFDRCQQLGPKYWVFFKSGDPEVDTIRSLTDQEIDSNPAFIYEAIVAKVTELSIAAGDNITGGFISNAIGEDRIYDSEVEDQLNLVGAAATVAPTSVDPEGSSMYYSSRDIATETKTYLPHTYAQLRQVLADGAAFKLAVLVQFTTLRATVEAMTSVTDINAVVWTPVEQ